MRSTKAPRVVRAALKADKKRRRQAYFEAEQRAGQQYQRVIEPVYIVTGRGAELTPQYVAQD